MMTANLTTTAATRRTTSSESPQEALARIQSMQFCGNDVLVIQAFADAGIPPELIDPRFNVLTFKAWKAKGRRVAKGAKSIGVTVWIPIKGKKPETSEAPAKDGDKPKRSGMRPKVTRLFHECQTVPADAAKGTKPEAWNNPALVREGTYEAEETPVAHVGRTIADAFGMHDLPNTVVYDDQPAIEDNGRIQATLAEVQTLEPAGECNCPMPGFMTNVDCPVHADMNGQEMREALVK